MMDSAASARAANEVAWAMHGFVNQVIQVAQLQMSPHVLLKPRLCIDGDQWCALYGENLQSGIAGFGDTPERAMLDFDQNYRFFKAGTARAAKDGKRV